jgi:hypothetical protein
LQPVKPDFELATQARWRNAKRLKMKKAILFLTLSLFLLALSACTSTPENSENKPGATAAKPAFQPSYETGRAALQKMYIAARGWSPDSKPYRLQSQATKDDNGQDGKAGIWQGGFASPSRREIKLYTWSGIDAEGAPEPGINSRAPDTYSPANTSTQIFDLAFLKKDSSDAFDVAQKHGGDKLTKKTPDMQIFYVLEWDGRKNQLYWRVLYDSSNDPKLAVDVDASTGIFIRVER